MTARLWVKSDLGKDFTHDILRYSFSMPTLPACQFENVIEEINALINFPNDKEIENKQNLLKFTKYLKDWWLPQAAYITSDGENTNFINISEYFQRHIGSNLGSTTPDIFQFTERVRRLNNEYDKVWNDMDKGATYQHFENQCVIKITNHIKKLLVDLQDGRISLLEYLQTAIEPSMQLEILTQLKVPQYLGDEDNISELPDLQLMI
ncbi:uncharacterized protein LOC141532056 [Cotesia typhae]|uniref:uncharacterized protein LOC141532056 n=1 Tax=Cotesia typhae TaxID=2053667 RepID=UPI003D69248A